MSFVEQAGYVVEEAAKIGPIRVEPLPDDDQHATGTADALPPSVPTPPDDPKTKDKRSKAPPRVLKRCLAPTPDLEAHRKCLVRHKNSLSGSG
jgi:hypothetical protein